MIVPLAVWLIFLVYNSTWKESKLTKQITCFYVAIKYGNTQDPLSKSVAFLGSCVPVPLAHLNYIG